MGCFAGGITVCSALPTCWLSFEPLEMPKPSYKLTLEGSTLSHFTVYLKAGMTAQGHEQCTSRVHSLVSLFSEPIHRNTLPQVSWHIFGNDRWDLQILGRWGFVVMGRDIRKVGVFYLMCSGPFPSPWGSTGLPTHHCNQLVEWSFAPFGRLQSPAEWGHGGGRGGVHLHVSGAGGWGVGGGQGRGHHICNSKPAHNMEVTHYGSTCTQNDQRCFYGLPKLRDW